MEFNYRKYRWFFTNSGKLVYGGKSAEQNEEVVRDLMRSKENFLVMHTKTPGSPFAVIVSQIRLVRESDLDEVAVWTACFSRAWRNKKKKIVVDYFEKNQIYKEKGMKEGTFGVKRKKGRKEVELKLVLTRQRGSLRAVPEKTPRLNTRTFGTLIPGDVPKEKISEQISKELKIKKEEVLNALPTGGFSWKNDK